MTNSLIDLLYSNSIQKIFKYELFKVPLQDKKDVKQNCIFTILKALKRYGESIPQEKLSSFCQTIIRRTVIDYVRNQKSMKHRHCVLTDFQSEISTSYIVRESQFDVIDVRVSYEMNADKFSNREKMIADFLLYNDKASGMNMSEVARELKINKSLVTRTLQKLRLVC